MSQKQVLDEKTRALGDERFTARKNRFKKVRTVFQLLVIVGVLVLLFTVFFSLKEYQPYEAEAPTAGGPDTGFVAISYFGVDRQGDTSTRIGQAQLREHLQALKDQGYVTITQQDIEDYYKQGKPLPKRSLYLMFEDGRRDTGVLSQSILEDLNYKATVMTYPEKFGNKDPKFLLPKDLKEMEESTFWEMGSNGYRLEYINVYDRYHNYLGELDPLRFACVGSYLERDYNHYLMDYIRDKNGISKESRNHMEKRISYDYEKLRDIYEDEIGYIPPVYVLMHANTGKYGNNPSVSDVNEKWIHELFKICFNREGYSFNQRNSSIYDLTRMQPQPYWPVNHLLMRLKHDINQPIEFVKGTESRQRDWNLIDGAAEIREESYILTTLPEGRALSRVNASGDLRNMRLAVNLKGNAFGEQQIFLRADEKMTSYICVKTVNDRLVITELAGGKSKELYREKIPVILGEKIPSDEEMKKEAEVIENETFARYASSIEEAEKYRANAEKRKEDKAVSVKEGAKPYEGTKSFHKRASHHLEINLKADTISVMLDNHEAGEVKVAVGNAGSVYVGGSWKGEAWSQRNLADDVYDAVFDKLTIWTNNKDDETVLFTTEYRGTEKLKKQAWDIWDGIINWFLTYL